MRREAKWMLEMKERSMEEKRKCEAGSSSGDGNGQHATTLIQYGFDAQMCMHQDWN